MKYNEKSKPVEYESEFEEYILNNTNWKLIEENVSVEGIRGWSLINTDNENLLCIDGYYGSVFVKKSNKEHHYHPRAVIDSGNNLYIFNKYLTAGDSDLTEDLKTLGQLQKGFLESGDRRYSSQVSNTSETSVIIKQFSHLDT
ncbi:MAG: hypothetical protein U9Q92_07400 [archaeon]|nr:hypothetical protein [archaeon]